MKKEIWGILVVVVFMTGCATVQKQKEPTKSELEIIDIKMKQLLAMSETSLEVSKKAEELAQESLETSRKAELTSQKSLEASNKATEAANEARKFAEQEVEKAIKATNETRKFAEEESQKAVDASNRASKTAMDYADRSAEKSIAAANEAIKAANASSEKSIAVANQTIAEINRMRATTKMQEEQEPILMDEPVAPVTVGKPYTIKRGDTLCGLASRYYKDSGKWKLIYNANKQIIKDPDLLIPGTKIVIP
jgi:nucleoid-associated protein YgaU